jgi:hypothetical protein
MNVVRRLLLLMCLSCVPLALLAAAKDVSAPAKARVAIGPAIKRVANMPDGAPAFEISNQKGQVVRRVECINNGWYNIDEFAARFVGSREVMASIIAKDGSIEMAQLGPAVFDCVVVSADSTKPTTSDIAPATPATTR